MSHAEFVHLHAHDAFSLSEGAIKTDDLVDLCVRHRMPAVAVTNSNNLFGALEFSLAARARGVQPIIGCQLAVQRDDDGARGQIRPDQIVLLAQDESGYRNLLALVSMAYLDSPGDNTAEVTLEAVERRSAGLIALTGGPAGGVGRLLLEGRSDLAEALLLRLAVAFPDRLYVELMRHDAEAEERIEPELVALAFAHNLPLVATNDVYFAEAEMYEAHDALLCIADGATVSRRERRRVTPEHRFKSAEEMRALFADLPEAVDNTLVVARRCAFMPDMHDPILPAYPKLNGRTEVEVLRDMAVTGLQVRLDELVFTPDMDADVRAETAARYRQRLDYELGMIEQMGFPGYFLIVADFIQWAKAQDIPVGPGRGSGAGSVVAWALTITDLDPLRWGLLFERFLNPERVSMPDFDIDFCKDRRDHVIQYVQKEYGRDRVAQIITFGKLEARAALRDVGRVLEMPYGKVDRICKLVPNNPANPVRLSQAVAGEPMLQAMQAEDEEVARLIDVALKLEGLYRHASTHAAGVVIGDRPLEELVPLYRDPRSDMPVTQFNMKFVEKAGLVKFDFLGLKTLTVLKGTLDLLKARGVSVDLAKIPLDDEPTYKMICRADTTGVFQLESTGMRDVLKQLRPDRFEDIIAVVALYRPGPMDNIPSFIRRKHGEEAADYPHPSVETILKETYGIMIYQEQVMQIAQTLANYSLGSADLLRRAMGKKIQSEMDAQRESFVAGALVNGLDEALAGTIFDQVAKFAGYGFNKSHAAAYALVAYQTAYMKANYPVEFFAASMTEDMGTTDKLAQFRAELDRLSIPLLPPDVNRSEERFSVEDAGDGRSAVRYALAALKNVGATAMAALVAERRQNGPYGSLFEFAERVDPRVMNKRQLENLARAGTFDSLNRNRRQVHAAVEVLLRHANAAHNDRETRQESLFGGEAAAQVRTPLPDVEDWPAQERLNQEFEAIGFYLSAHPLEAYKEVCRRLKVVEWRAVASRQVRGDRLKLAGIVTARRFTTSSRGSRMAFVQMSDATGAFEVTVFSEVLAACRELIESGSPLVLTVDVQPWNDGFRLTAQDISPLEEAAARSSKGLRVFVRDDGPLGTLATVFRDHGGRGSGRVQIVFDVDEGEVEMELPSGYAISAAMRAAVKAIPGIVEVQDL